MLELINTNELCSYGCGKIAKFKNASNKLMCDSSANKCPENKRKNSLGNKRAHALEKNHENYSSRYSKMSKDSKENMKWRKGKYTANFSLNGKGSHKKILVQERGHKCESCNLTEWLNEPIPLELEHCDGNNLNNIKDNLLLLCPNCHAKTKYYRGRNINTGKQKVSDNDLLISLKSTSNIRTALLKVGLTPKGSNYKRAKNLLLRE